MMATSAAGALEASRTKRARSMMVFGFAVAEIEPDHVNTGPDHLLQQGGSLDAGPRWRRSWWHRLDMGVHLLVVNEHSHGIDRRAPLQNVLQQPDRR